MRRALALVVVLLLAGGAAWRFLPRHSAGTTDSKARVSFTWGGSQTGSASLPAELSWCPISRSALLLAVSGDTGLLVTLTELDSLHLVSHRVVPFVPNPPPLSATGSFRYTRDSLILGFSAENGSVDLRSGTAQSVSGSFAILMRRPGMGDTVRVQGSFANLPVVVKAKDCP